MTITTLNIQSISKKMRSMVERAIEIIRTHAHNPIPTYKLGYAQKAGDTPDDFATQGDIEAQEMYQVIITTDPELDGFGIIGEEGLNLPCTLDGMNAYFTIDPLDGTKAYERKSSFGVGTMLALVINGKVVASYIGDVNTGEVYRWTEGNHATRTRFGQISVLAHNPVTLRKQYIVFKEATHKLSSVFRHLFGDGFDRPLFKDLEVASGSVGTMTARLWKGEIGALVFPIHYETPWDHTPIAGISYALDYVFLRYDVGLNNFVEEEPILFTEVTHRPDSLILLHRHHLPEFRAWMDEYKKR